MSRWVECGNPGCHRSWTHWPGASLVCQSCGCPADSPYEDREDAEEALEWLGLDRSETNERLNAEFGNMDK